MVKAYSLVSVEPGKASEVFEEISKMDAVNSVEAVTGPYDIIAQMEVDSLERLTQTLFGDIRGISGVTSTTTLIVVGLR